MKGFVQLFKLLFKSSFPRPSQNSSQSSSQPSSEKSSQSLIRSNSVPPLAVMVMSRLVMIVLPIVLVAGLFVGLVNVDPALAAPIVPPSVKTTLTKSVDKTVPKAIIPKAEVSLGEKIFTGNCAACHIGGNNVILAEKNLSKAALEQYAMNSVAAIKTQVTGGKNAMPAFGENLTSAEIEAVARYVITQSQLDWRGSSVGLQ